MQVKSGVNCLVFCLLVTICAAVPLFESDFGSHTDGERVRRQGDDDAINDAEADQAVNEELSDDANEPVNADENDDVNEPVNAEEKNDISGASQPIGAEEENKVEDNETVTNQLKNLNEGPLNVSDDVPESNEKQENAPPDAEQDTIRTTTMSSSTSDDNVKMTALISNDCKLGNSNCKLVLEKINHIPGFKLSSDEQTKFKLWPDARIPYIIDEFSYDKDLSDVIRRWLINAHVLGLQFTELAEPPENDDQRWVFFVNRRGQLDCKDYSTNSFTNKGVQKVIIGYDCLKHEGPMAAIIMALAGVPPQHNAPDRDEYITINENHILPNKKGLFKKLTNGDWLFHDLGYDFNSVSHYDAHKYSADGFQTIEYNKKDKDGQETFFIMPVPKDNKWTLKNDAKTYSNTDILKVRMLYNKLGLSTAKTQLKPEECNSLFRPGPNYNKLQWKEKIDITEYPKPKKYIDAVGGNTGDPSPTMTEPDGNDDNKQGDQKLFAIPGRDVEGEQLSSLEKI